MYGNNWMQKEESVKSSTILKEVNDTTAAGGGTIIINPWPDSVVEGYFEL